MTVHSPTVETTPASPAGSLIDDRAGRNPSKAASLRQLGRRRTWSASAAVFLVFAGLFFATSAPFAVPAVEAACEQQPPDMRFFTSADDMTSFLDACGPGGRQVYRNMQLADLLYPAVVGLFLASSLAAVLGRISRQSSNVIWLAALPLVASSFDYLENLSVWAALARYPDTAPTNAVLGYASAAKTVCFWASGMVLVAALVLLGVQVLRQRVGSAEGRSGTAAPPMVMRSRPNLKR